jgi:succinyl-CoA synthetase beta subunit
MLTEYSRDQIAEHNLPYVACGIDSMLRSFGRLAWWSDKIKFQPALPAIASESQKPGPVITGERAVLDHLASAGVPVIPATVATTRAEAEAAAAGSKDLLVLKISSPDIEHKTEVGGVRLNVAPGDVGDAFDGVLAAVKAAKPNAKIDGIIVSPMRKGGVELLVGITRDPVWGPMLSVGLGGVLVEIMADVVTAPLPVERDEIVEMLGRLRGKKLLEGYRGARTAGIAAIADAVAAIAAAALSMGSNLESLEVNPLLVGEDKVEALDALAIWAE